MVVLFLVSATITGLFAAREFSAPTNPTFSISWKPVFPPPAFPTVGDRLCGKPPPEFPAKAAQAFQRQWKWKCLMPAGKAPPILPILKGPS
jgi:hypothetical protein